MEHKRRPIKKKKRRSKNGVLEYEPPVQVKRHPKIQSDRPFISRSRATEIAIVEATLVSVKYFKSSKDIQKILVETLKQYSWFAVYLRMALDPNKHYRLKSWHLEKMNWERSDGKMTIPMGFFQILTRLQFNKLPPQEAAKEWKAMLMELPEDFRHTANRVLDKDFKPITRVIANRAMKECGTKPLIPKKGEE